MDWCTLSPEVLRQVFARLEPQDLLTCRRVCAYWNRVIENISGLPVCLQKLSHGNISFAKSIHVSSMTVKNMPASRKFSLKSPNSMKKLFCCGPVNSSWFTEQVLQLKNLTILKLHGDFFYLQDLPSSATSLLPNLHTLIAETPANFRRVTPLPSCIALPKVQGKISERIARNMCIILKLIRSPKLSTVKLIDEFPRCIDAGALRNQWCGQVMADFISYHRYSLKHFHLKKTFIPYPEDPFSTEDADCYPTLEKLSLYISGTDVGTFHYWRALLEAQRRLKSLELHIGGAFWHRFPVIHFISISSDTLKHMDLSLDYEMDAADPLDEGGFDFQDITKCCHLESLKVGPCGFLTPTRNFHLVPRLLRDLVALQLTFLNITTEDLQGISRLEALKSLKLRCLVKFTGDVVSSPINLALVKVFLAMRSLDTLSVDFITTSDSKAVAALALRLYGKKFKGNGFFFPYEAENDTMISEDTLRAAPSVAQDEEEEQCTGLSFTERARRLEEGARDFNGSRRAVFGCPCESRPRVRRRKKQCISRYCVPAMVDLCEDLIKAGKHDLWDAYIDGQVGFDGIQDFILDAPERYDPTKCYCELTPSDSEDDDGAKKEVTMETHTVVSSEVNKNPTKIQGKEQRRPSLLSLFQSVDYRCAESVEDRLNYYSVAMEEPGERLEVIHSKDWFTQTDLRRQDSMDVMTQYENQRAVFDFRFSKDLLSLHDSSSQTDIHSKSMTDISIQKDTPATDISTQKETTGTDNSTQHAVELKESSSQKEIQLTSVAIQNGVVSFNMEAQTEVSLFQGVVDFGMQKYTNGEDKGSQCVELTKLNVATQNEFHGEDKETQKGSSCHDRSMETESVEAKEEGCQHEHVEGEEKGIQIFIAGTERGTQIVPTSSDVATQYENSSVSSSCQTEPVSNSVDAGTETVSFSSSTASQACVEAESTGFQTSVNANKEQAVQATEILSSTATQSEAPALIEVGAQTLHVFNGSTGVQVTLPLATINAETQYEPQAPVATSIDDNGNHVSTQYEISLLENKLKHSAVQWEGPEFVCKNCEMHLKTLEQQQDASVHSITKNESKLESLGQHDHAVGDAAAALRRTYSRKSKKNTTTTPTTSSGPVKRYCVIA